MNAIMNKTLKTMATLTEIKDRKEIYKPLTVLGFI